MVKKPTYFNIHPKDLPKKFFDGDMIGFYLGKYYRRNLSTNWETFVPWERFNVSIPVLSQKDVDLYKGGAVWIYFNGQWRYLGEFVFTGGTQNNSGTISSTGSVDTGSVGDTGSVTPIVYNEYNISNFSGIDSWSGLAYYSGYASYSEYNSSCTFDVSVDRGVTQNGRIEWPVNWLLTIYKPIGNGNTPCDWAFSGSSAVYSRLTGEQYNYAVNGESTKMFSGSGFLYTPLETPLPATVQFLVRCVYGEYTATTVYLSTSTVDNNLGLSVISGDSEWSRPLYMSYWGNDYGFDNFNGYMVNSQSVLSSLYSWANSTGSIIGISSSPIIENFDNYEIGTYISGSYLAGNWSV